MMSSIKIGGERRSHTKFGDDVTTTSWDTAFKVDGLYVSKGIHFGSLIQRTTVNISIKGFPQMLTTNSLKMSSKFQKFHKNSLDFAQSSV